MPVADKPPLNPHLSLPASGCPQARALRAPGLMRLVCRLAADPCGSPLIEYALAGGLIAIAAVGALSVIGVDVSDALQGVAAAWP